MKEAPNPRTRVPDQRDPVPEIDVRFLDLDGDGVPDAVETRKTEPLHVGADGRPDVVREIDEIDSDIDDDGTVRSVHITETLGADLDHDGVAEVTEVISYGRSARPAAPER